jgi:hypothetical protein
MRDRSCPWNQYCRSLRFFNVRSDATVYASDDRRIDVTGGRMTKHLLLPEGEELRRAVQWIGEQGEHTLAAVEEACRRFDLSPADEDFMIRHFVQPPPQKKPE